MAVQDPSVNFGWDVANEGGDFDVWGAKLNVIFADDGADSIDSILWAVKQTADGALQTTGGTIQGDLTIAGSGTHNLNVRSTDGAANVTVSRGNTSNGARIHLEHNQVDRWQIGLTADADADLVFVRCDDAGVVIGSSLTLDRSSGAVVFAGGLTGSGSGLTNLNATQLTSGTIPQARFPGTLTEPNTYRAAADGSAGAPAYSFGSDTNTGMYRAGENDLRFATAATDGLRVTETLVQVLGGRVFSGNGSLLSSLDASNLASGTVPQARLSSLIGDSAQEFQAKTGTQGDPSYTFAGDPDTGMYESGANVIAFTTGGARRAQIDATGIQLFSGTFQGSGAGLTSIPASATSSGTFSTERIPGLPASQITSGTFALARIPNLPASQITSGTFALARIPNLPASQITSGTINNARLPATISQTDITASDLLNGGRLQVGGGSVSEFIRTVEVLWTNDVTSGNTSTQNFAVTGSLLGDHVWVSTERQGSDAPRMLFYADVSSNGTVSVDGFNAGGVSQTDNLVLHLLVVRT